MPDSEREGILARAGGGIAERPVAAGAGRRRQHLAEVAGAGLDDLALHVALDVGTKLRAVFGCRPRVDVVVREELGFRPI